MLGEQAWLTDSILFREHLNQNTADVDDLVDENAFTLTGFEAVQLADLAIDNVEEAKTLIPTYVFLPFPPLFSVLPVTDCEYFGIQVGKQG